MSTMQPYKIQVGKKIEELAAKYLIAHDLEIIEKNFSCKFGEIDLICKDPIEDQIVFVEVRYRRSKFFGEPINSINYAKQNKLINAANYYVSKKFGELAINYRFDIITAQGPLDQIKIDWFIGSFD